MECMEYCYEAIERKLALKAIQPSTARDYRISLNAWVPYLSGIELGEVTRGHVERGLADMLARGIAANTALKRHVALNMALSQAVAEEKISRNPMDGLPKPKKTRPEQNPLAGYELDRVKSLLSSMTQRPWVIAVQLCLYAGLRIEEACALQVQDIDLAAGVGWVRRAIGYGDGGAYVAPPKGGRPRDFPLCDNLLSVLSSHLAGKNRGAGSWLLGSTRWLDPRLVGRKWSALCEVEEWRGIAGRKPTLHDLRHTFATACVRANMDVKTLQSILGHSSAAVTLDVYSSADPSAKRAARDLIGAAI